MMLKITINRPIEFEKAYGVEALGRTYLNTGSILWTEKNVQDEQRSRNMSSVTLKHLLEKWATMFQKLLDRYNI